MHKTNQITIVPNTFPSLCNQHLDLIAHLRKSRTINMQRISMFGQSKCANRRNLQIIRLI